MFPLEEEHRAGVCLKFKTLVSELHPFKENNFSLSAVLLSTSEGLLETEVFSHDLPAEFTLNEENSISVAALFGMKRSPGVLLIDEGVLRRLNALMQGVAEWEALGVEIDCLDGVVKQELRPLDFGVCDDIFWVKFQRDR